jgi:hypothetical protein
MKTVFSSISDVLHVYAQRTQNNGKASSVFFYGDKIYSYGYHYLMGEFVTNPKGETAIIINDKGYSSSTASHISGLTMATRQYKQFFTKQMELDNVLYEIEQNVKSLQTARKKEKYINPSIVLFDALNEYIIWSNKKDIKKDERYKKIVKLIKIINGDDLQKYLDDNKKRLIADAKKKEKQRIAKLKIELENFENYKVDRIYNSDEDFLRLSQNGEFVETSQWVKVSIKEAKILYLLIVAKKDIKGFKIANYTVISINGTLKIGCHHINIDSVHKIGQLLIKNF